MGTYDGSILTETKKSLGLGEENTPFDTEIMMYINGAFADLNQLGLGPDVGYAIESDEEIWEDFLADDLKLGSVKTYVHLVVKQRFDPPSTSWTQTALKDEIEKLEFRLSIAREDKIAADADALPEEPTVLDGGVV